MVYLTWLHCAERGMYSIFLTPSRSHSLSSKKRMRGAAWRIRRGWGVLIRQRQEWIYNNNNKFKFLIRIWIFKWSCVKPKPKPQNWHECVKIVKMSSGAEKGEREKRRGETQAGMCGGKGCESEKEWTIRQFVWRDS